MSKVRYEIISTGSTGNAVVLNENILVDAGVSYKAVQPFQKGLRLVLLTHVHGDHFNPSMLRKIAFERPTLRFGCGAWFVPALTEIGIKNRNIDILSAGKSYNYGTVKIFPIPLVHNVPNQGYKLHFADGGKMVYATDTGSLDGITAKDYDLYMIEANHEEAEIRERLHSKESTGEYAYERSAMINHLSREQCDEWIYSNIGARGEYIYMHQHRERGG